MGLFDFFKSDNNKPSIDLKDFKFLSDDHTRFENGRPNAANNKGAWRGIRVKTFDNKVFYVTIYNMNENHHIWGDNIQMSEKQMKMLEETDVKIVLRGFGTDRMGSSFADYGLTLNKKNGIIDEITLNIFDRNIKIVYKKALKKESAQVVSFEQIRSEFFTGANALNSNNFSKAITAFKETLNLIQTASYNDIELESSCHYNIGNAYKFSNQLQEAIDSFSSALNIKATNEDAYLGLSDCYFLLDNNNSLEKVINILSTCISYFPNNKIAHLNKGVALFKLNRYNDAYTSFKKAQQLGDEDAGFYIEVVRKYI